MLRSARRAWFSLSLSAAGVALVAIGSLPARAGTPEPTLSHADELGCAACASAKQALAFSAPAPPRGGADRVANLTSTDVLHYDLDIEIIPSTQNIAGSNTFTVESRVNGLATFEFRLSNTFTITGAQVGATPVSWLRTDSIHVTVTLDQTYDVGEQFDLTIEYAGPASGGGFGSIVWSSSAGKPYAYTLSEAWFAYTWWPNKDDATDKATADLTFTIPDSVFLVSNGLLLSDTPVAGAKRRLHYRTNYQTATYLFQFALGDYNTFSGSHPYTGGVMPLEFALLSGSDSPTARNAWLLTEDMLPVFDDLFGLYPFIDEKYGIYQFGFAGGMEHQTMTGQGTTSASVTAHELAHQWWGDMITCAVWNDIWLQEGFATYSEALWIEFQGGSSNLAALKSAMAARKPSNVNDSVYVYNPTNMNRIFDYNLSYLKGGWVLHTLRGVLGDTDFFATLAAYRAAYEYGASSTVEFQAVAESVSGLDLDAFFDQWIFQPGQPEYRTAFGNYTINGQAYVEVQFTQVQSASWPTFVMPVQLRFTTGAGDHNVTVFNDERAEHFLIPVPAAASALSVDPDQWILRGNNTGTSYVPGPPKIAQASPAPGEVVAGSLPQIAVSFHRDVQITGADVSLVGQSTGPVGATFAYNAPTRTLTLTPTSALGADTYTVTVLDSVIGVSNALALDGEIADDLLPSGDGLAGGDASYSFQFVPPPGCAGDIDDDGDTDVFDFAIFTANFGTLSGATRQDGDLDANGTVDVFDFAILSGDFGCGL